MSVLVACHNELENLQSLLPILLGQQYAQFEVIIILDRCTDGSREFLNDFSDQKLRVISIEKSPSGVHPKKNAIQKGIEAASGEWILLTDADCRPSTNWVSEMAKHMTNEIVIGISPYQKTTSFLNELIQYETFQTAVHFCSATANNRPYMALGRNLAYKKSLFEHVGGFGETKHVTGGDDDLVIQRMLKTNNFSLALEKNAPVDSIPETSWSSYFKQKTRHLSVGKHYPNWVKRRESFRWTIHTGMWLTFFVSLFQIPVTAVVILALTFILKAISINIVADRLEKRFNHLWLPFVDLIYAVLMPLIGLRSLLVKNIKWN